MGKLKVLSTEFGLPVSLGGNTFNVVGTKDNPLDSNDLIFAANNDAFAFITLYHLGLIQNSTFIWLPVHAIEKYLKAYLLAIPSYDEKKLKNIGHNILELWKAYKKEFSYNDFDVIEEYINELSEISPHVRYGNKSMALNDNLISGFIYLVVHFNKFKRGSKNYPNSYYGFYDNEIPSINFISQGNLEKIIKSYFHLIIEHNVTLSPAGVCHPHKYWTVNILKQSRHEEDCPFCNNKIKFDPKQTGMTNTIMCELTKEFLNKQ